MADENHNTQSSYDEPLHTQETQKSKPTKWSDINEIYISNFKAIDSCTVPLERVNILVGPNGCGKSSVLQAIHWATRASSYILPKMGKEVVRFERLDYVPSSEPLRTAFKGELQTNQKSPPTVIEFRYNNDEEQPEIARIQIWGARNKSGISVHIEGGSRVTPFKQRDNFITAYIPGLAGLSENESILAQPLLRRKAASGDAGGVLRNILLSIASSDSGVANKINNQNGLDTLNSLISEIYPSFRLYVRFDEREDFNIDAGYIEIESGLERPLETAATGILQIVQIFSYLVLFKPRLILIDEPDAHLHPNKQESLISALEEAANTFDTQIILTTHSPNMVRAASPETKIIWMDKGSVKTSDDQKVRTLMGWGGLEKKIILFTEDEDDRALRAILRQWPDLNGLISVCRTFGLESLPRNNLIKGLFEDVAIDRLALILRDRDFMTDEELKIWKENYTNDRTLGICTIGSDIESYFCSKFYLSNALDISSEYAESLIDRSLDKIVGPKSTFKNKRKEIIRSMYKDGGSPNSETLWESAGGLCPATTLGKPLLKAIASEAHKEGLESKKIQNFYIPENIEIAGDIRSEIQYFINKNHKNPLH